MIVRVIAGVADLTFIYRFGLRGDIGIGIFVSVRDFFFDY